MIYNDNVEKEREREKEKTSLMWGFWPVKFLPKFATNQNISTKKPWSILQGERMMKTVLGMENVFLWNCVWLAVAVLWIMNGLSQRVPNFTEAFLNFLTNMGIIVCHHVCMELYTKLSLCRNLQLIWFVNMHIHIWDPYMHLSCVYHASMFSTASTQMLHEVGLQTSINEHLTNGFWAIFKS